MKSDDEKPAAEKTAKTETTAKAAEKTPAKATEKEDKKPVENTDDTSLAESDPELVVADLDPSDDMDEPVQFGKPAAADGPHAATVDATATLPIQLVPTMKVLLVLAVVGVLGWSALTIIKRVGAPKVNSYQTCVQAGGAVQESYPPVCTDKKSGKHYDAFSAKRAPDVD